MTSSLSRLIKGGFSRGQARVLDSALGPGATLWESPWIPGFDNQNAAEGNLSGLFTFDDNTSWNAINTPPNFRYDGTDFTVLRPGIYSFEVAFDFTPSEAGSGFYGILLERWVEDTQTWTNMLQVQGAIGAVDELVSASGSRVLPLPTGAKLRAEVWTEAPGQWHIYGGLSPLLEVSA